MTTTIKIHVNGQYKTIVKHVAGGVDRANVEIGPNEEKSFSFVGDVGENVFFVGPEVHISMKPAMDVQEESKLAAEAKAGIPSQRKEELALAAQTGAEVRDEYKLDPATADKLSNLHDKQLAENAGWTGGVTTAESEAAQAEIQANAIEKAGAENAAKNTSSSQSATEANTAAAAAAKKAEDDKKASASTSSKK